MTIENRSCPVRISFGMIVLNGMPFLLPNLRSLYPYAHQLLIVEGAAPAGRSIARSDGHSRDGTLEALRSFQAEEDPENKVIVVTAEDEGFPDGVWPGEKDQMSAAYARRATGDWLWQVDADEFYRGEDIERLSAILQERSDVHAVSFRQLAFWGAPDVRVRGWQHLSGSDTYHRLFRWGAGSRYATHRPPTVFDRDGCDVREKGHLGPEELEREGICLYHYSLLLPKQVEEKMAYYAAAPWLPYADRVADWARENYLHGLARPFAVHNVLTKPSWLEPYTGEHPEAAMRMWRDLPAGEKRPMDDVRALLASSSYRWWRGLVRVLFLSERCRWLVRGRLREALLAIRHDVSRGRLDLGPMWRRLVRCGGAA